MITGGSVWMIRLRATLIQSGLFKAQKVYQWKPRLSARWRLRPFWFGDTTTTLGDRIRFKTGDIEKDIRDWRNGW